MTGEDYDLLCNGTRMTRMRRITLSERMDCKIIMLGWKGFRDKSYKFGKTNKTHSCISFAENSVVSGMHLFLIKIACHFIYYSNVLKQER